MFMFVSGFLLLDVLRQDLFILCLSVLGGLEPVQFVSPLKSLSSQSLFSNQSLHFRRLVESFVSSLDFPPHNVLSHIILLPQSEHLSNVISPLRS